MADQRRVVHQRTEAYGYSVTPPIGEVVTTERVEHHPSGGEMLRRVIVFVFGVIQVLLILRIIGLLLDAQRGNDIVRIIYDVSAILVAPFEGIFRTDEIGQAGSVLDVTAIVALIGWTILEVLILAAISLFRREPA